MNVTAYRILKKLVELHPEEYVWAEDVIKVFGSKNQMREIAWSVLPSKILGPLPPEQYHYPPEYSKAMTIHKKHGLEGVATYLKETHYRERLAVYNNLVRGDAVTMYKLITGLEPSLDAMRVMHEWKKIKSGKDLFIKGLGTFNIRDVALRVSNLQMGRFGDPGIRPIEITTMGYFNSLDWSLTQLINNKRSPVLAHIVRFKKQWTIELLGRAHELTSLHNIDPEFSQSQAFDRPPEILLQLARARRDEITIENEHARSDFSPFKPVDVPIINFEDDYSLRIVKSPQELKDIAQTLIICTDNPDYSVRMRLGKIQMWTLYKEDSLIGVGELDKKGAWSQIRGMRNSVLKDEELQLFNRARNIIN